MLMDDALDGCEADACAREFRHRVQSLECAKQLAGISHIEPGTIIADEERGRASAIGLAHLDARGVATVRREPPAG